MIAALPFAFSGAGAIVLLEDTGLWFGTHLVGTILSIHGMLDPNSTASWPTQMEKLEFNLVRDRFMLRDASGWAVGAVSWAPRSPEATVSRTKPTADSTRVLAV